MKHLRTCQHRKLLPPLDPKEQEAAGNHKIPATGETYLTGANQLQERVIRQKVRLLAKDGRHREPTCDQAECVHS